jgi:hypothetical protein
VASFSCVRREDRQAERLLLLQCVIKPQGLPPFLRNQLLLPRPSTSTREIWLGPGRASGAVIQFTNCWSLRRHNDGGAGPGGRLPAALRPLPFRSQLREIRTRGKRRTPSAHYAILRLRRGIPGPSPPDESKPKGPGRAQRQISTSTQCQPSIRSLRDSMNDCPCVRPP